MRIYTCLEDECGASSSACASFYGPPNYLVAKFDAEDRRMFGFWSIIFAIVGSIWWHSLVWWVVILSILALIPNYASETPVETEDGGDSRPPE